MALIAIHFGAFAQFLTISAFLISYSYADNELLWPSWRKFNTIHLNTYELKNYMRKIFSKKIENSPQNVSWVFVGIQGVDASYVSTQHFWGGLELDSML